MELPGPIGGIGRRIKLGPLGPVTDIPFNVKTLADAGVIAPVRPDKLARSVRELVRYGASPAAGIESTVASCCGSRTPPIRSPRIFPAISAFG